MKISRLELALLVAFGLGLSAEIALHPPVQEAQQGAEGVQRWEQQETAVQEQIQETFAVDQAEFQARLETNPALRQRLQLVFFGLILLMLASGAAFLRWILKLLRGLPVSRPLGTPPPPTWGFRQILRLGLVALVAMQFASVTALLFSRGGQMSGFDHHWVALMSTFLIDAVVLVGAFWLLFRRAGPPCHPCWYPIPDVSYPRPEAGAPKLRDKLQLALGAYLTVLPLLAVLLLGVVMVLRALSIEPPPQPVVTMYLSEDRTGVLGWLLVLVAVVGPVTEEFFFRGVLYGWLRTRVHRWHALILTAVCFGALHAHLAAFFPIFGLGLLFGWVYERTGSLAAPIAIHVFHNIAILILASTLKAVLIP